MLVLVLLVLLHFYRCLLDSSLARCVRSGRCFEVQRVKATRLLCAHYQPRVCLCLCLCLCMCLCLWRVLQDWLVPASLSDDEIELLLELLPPASELYARAAGERRAGSGKRRNDWSTHRADIGGVAAAGRCWRRHRQALRIAGTCGSVSLVLCVLVWLWRR